MIKEVFRCPHCDRPVAIDCVTGDVVFDPDGPSAGPCAHLTCLWICLTFCRSKRFAKKYSRSWNWVLGRGIVKIDAVANVNDVALTRYIMDCGSASVTEDLLPSDPTFRVVGASAGQREERKAGTGEFRVQIGEKAHTAILDGWGIYSQRPCDLMREIGQLAFEYEV